MYLQKNRNAPLISIITVVYNDVRECGDECHPIVLQDFDGNCDVGLDDFAEFASWWLVCTKPACDDLSY